MIPRTTKNQIHFLNKLCLKYVNSLPASGNFFCLLIIFTNCLDLDQDQQNVGADLDPNCLTLIVFLKKVNL